MYQRFIRVRDVISKEVKAAKAPVAIPEGIIQHLANSSWWRLLDFPNMCQLGRARRRFCAIQPGCVDMAWQNM